MASGRLFEMSPPEAQVPEDDIEVAFNSWRISLEDSESPGNIKAFRIPFDADGKASHSSANQIRLGAWPVDQYDFDSLCDKLVKEFMLPTENMMAVRLIGTMAGKQGIRFNKLVVLQRSNAGNQLALPNPGSKDGLTETIRAMQESNERTLKMIQEMGGARSGDSQTEFMRMMAMSQMMNKPMIDMLTAMLPALAGRPLPAAGPSSSMKEMVETMMMVDKFLGRRGGGGSEEQGWGPMVTAVAGVAKPLLEIAAANTQHTSTRQRRPVVAVSVPTAPATATPVVAATPPAAPVSPVTPPTNVPPAGVDLSRPSAPTVVPTATVDPQVPSPQGDPMFAQLKQQVDALVEVAQTGSTPVDVANGFFEMTMLPADEKTYGQLANLAENPGFLNMLAMYNPKVHEHKAFFEAMRDQLVKRITEEDEASGTQAG